MTDDAEGFEIGLTEPFSGERTKWIPLEEFDPEPRPEEGWSVQDGWTGRSQRWTFSEIEGIRTVEEEDPEPEYPEKIGGFEARVVFEDSNGELEVLEDRGGDLWLSETHSDDHVLVTSDDEMYSVLSEVVSDE